MFCTQNVSSTIVLLEPTSLYVQTQRLVTYLMRNIRHRTSCATDGMTAFLQAVGFDDVIVC